MRELRLSLERSKPTALPPLKDALDGVLEIGCDDAQSNTGVPAKLPKMQRAPPVLDDNLWEEITTEIKRKSLHDPSSLDPAKDEAAEAAEHSDENYSVVRMSSACPAANSKVSAPASPALATQEAVEQEVAATAEGASAPLPASPPAKAVANSPPLKRATVKSGPSDAMTVCIRRAGCTCTDCAEMSGLSLALVEDTADAKTESLPGDESFHSCEDHADNASCRIGSEADAMPVKESPGVSTVREELMRMGFSIEDADFAIQEAKEQSSEAPEDELTCAAPIEEDNDAAPAPEESTEEGTTEAEADTMPLAALVALTSLPCTQECDGKVGKEQAFGDDDLVSYAKDAECGACGLVASPEKEPAFATSPDTHPQEHVAQDGIGDVEAEGEEEAQEEVPGSQGQGSAGAKKATGASEATDEECHHKWPSPQKEAHLNPTQMPGEQALVVASPARETQEAVEEEAAAAAVTAVGEAPCSPFTLSTFDILVPKVRYVSTRVGANATARQRNGDPPGGQGSRELAAAKARSRQRRRHCCHDSVHPEGWLHVR